MRKHPPIDVIKLIREWDYKKWNELIFKKTMDQNVDWFVATRYGLQAGMDDAAKKKQNAAEINETYVRLLISLEKCMRQILKARFPMPNDDPTNKNITQDMLDKKRKRDQEFELFLKRSAF